MLGSKHRADRADYFSILRQCQILRITAPQRRHVIKNITSQPQLYSCVTAEQAQLWYRYNTSVAYHLEVASQLNAARKKYVKTATKLLQAPEAN
jgi:hypothetical protein